MEQQVKNIISPYLKIPADAINGSTVMDRSAVASSIILHRMYAQLSNAGFSVQDYSAIKTVDQLFNALQGRAHANSNTVPVGAVLQNTPANSTEAAVGIDIEQVAAMPVVSDFRQDAFYTQNFAAAEIAYCILQPDSFTSFAGLFAAKEAIIKADNNYQSYPFNSIIIDHLPSGKPLHPAFDISISHTADLAIAVAVKKSSSTTPLAGTPTTPPISQLVSLTALAVFISLFAVVICLLKTC